MQHNMLNGGNANIDRKEKRLRLMIKYIHIFLNKLVIIYIIYLFRIKNKKF